MITKVITNSFDFGEAAAQLVPLYGQGVDGRWMRKHANFQSIFHDVLQRLKPETGKTVIHVIALGDEEIYGPNRNGDGFSREDNVTAHKTFKELGNVFKNHQNNDPLKAAGDVIATAHHDTMSRVQLLLGLDNDKCRREVEALDRGEDVPVSMGCFTAGHLLTLGDGTTVPLESAKLGDIVLTHTGARRRVTHVFPDTTYTGTLYKLRAKTVDDIEATEEHPFFVIPRSLVAKGNYSTFRFDPEKLAELDVASAGQWVAVKDLNEGDYLVTPINGDKAGKSKSRYNTVEYQVYVPRTDAENLSAVTVKSVDSSTQRHRGGRRRRLGDYIITPIASIETREVVDEPIYNIEVEEDNSYLINGVAVHNSMQDFDVCSICGHKAPTAADHCSHIKTMLGQLLSDGRRVYMKNPNPKYFDISLVFKPADRIAYTLKKVASAGGGVIGGHELAEIYGLRPVADPKYAALKALATMYKEVPAAIRKTIQPADLSEETTSELKKQAKVHGIEHLLAFLHANGWLLGPKDFGQVIGHPSPEGCACAAEQHPVLDELLDDHTQVKALDVPSLPDYIPLSEFARADLDNQSSMRPDSANVRVMRLTIAKPSSRGKTALDEHEARGFASLYGHYKVAFAAQHQTEPAVLRNVAATF